MIRKVIASLLAPKAIGPYSQAVQAERTLYCSGQIPLDPETGELVQGDVTVQAERVLQNLKAVLESSGLGFSHVVKTTIFLADMGDFAKVNEVYARHFAPPYPARSTVQVAALPRGARVEIEAVAVG